MSQEHRSTNDSRELESFKDVYRQYLQDADDVPEWKSLKNAAVYRKHTGDLAGAIDAMVAATNLTRAVPELARETELGLNYLADLYLAANAIGSAERAIREAVALSRSLNSIYLADNVWVLADIQFRKGDYSDALVSAKEALDLYQQLHQTHGVGQARELIKAIQAKESMERRTP